jgi:DNA mismatch endonuclease (patch repair protein)
MTSAERSRIMRAVKGRDTKPEKAVRHLLHRLGYRYRLHLASLPGKPDLAFPGRQAVIFVHGCFWHGHECRRGARTPKDNRGYWVGKIARNQRRDEAHIGQLTRSGWRVHIVWECETKDQAALQRRLVEFLTV